MTPPKRSRLAGLGLAPRLLLNLLVIVAGAGTVLVTALLIAPAVFEAHLESVGVQADAQAMEHVARAFDQSLLVALGVGVLIADRRVSHQAARRPKARRTGGRRRWRNRQPGRRPPEVRVLPEDGPRVRQGSPLRSICSQTGSRTPNRPGDEQAADLAHQLRTPIASIRATVEAVREGVLPTDGDPGNVGLPERPADRLVDDLEVVSRAEERQLLLARTGINIHPGRGSRKHYREDTVRPGSNSSVRLPTAPPR